MLSHNSPRLITGCLEGISKRVFADFAAQIAELAGEKPGIYALYHRGKLYYVGLATDLRRRIKHHLEDKHARNWDTFSLYVVRREAHLRDLEAMTIRIKDLGNDSRWKDMTNPLMPKGVEHVEREGFRLEVADDEPSDAERR